MKRRKRGLARSKNDLSQTLALQGLELGVPIPSRLVFRSEIASLTHLRPVEKGLYPSNFSSTRHAYITRLVPSPDRALLAIASSDGHVEIHEPLDTETLRLEILPIQGTRLASVAWGSISSSDYLIVGLNENVVALYDLNTCQVDTPTRKFAHHGRSLSDVASLDNNAFAAAIPNRIEVYDARVRKGIAFVETRNRDSVLIGEDVFLYGADNGEVVLWDRRKLTSSNRLGTMSKRCDNALARRTITAGRFNDLCLIPGAAPGSLFFHHSDGTAGHIDMAANTFESVSEQDRRNRSPHAGESGLDPYGTAERALDYPWYVHRRRTDIICAPQGRGWRAIVPNVKAAGCRFVGFSSDMDMQSYAGTFFGSRHYSCVFAIEGQLNRIIFGDAKNRIQVQEIDLQAGEDRTK